MKKFLQLAYALFALTSSAAASVNVLVSGGTLRNQSGAPMANGGLVALLVSKGDNVFAAPPPGVSIRPGDLWSADDRVLAVWEIDSAKAGVAGGFVGSLAFDYAKMAIPNLGPGDRLMLVWFPNATLAAPIAMAGSPYGTYRVDTQSNKSNMTWAAPDDSTGGALALNVFTANLAGETPDSAANASSTVAAGAMAPVIAAQPSSQSIAQGGKMVVSVSAFGSAPLLYQWRKNGIAIAGATSEGLVVASVQEGDVAYYDAVVSNGVGTTISAAATLSLSFGSVGGVPPLISTHPADNTANIGGSVSFTVAASGAQPLTYQWNHNGAVLSGVSGSTLSIGSVSALDAGNYTVVVRNSAGLTTSLPAVLVVNSPPTPPVIAVHPQSHTAYEGEAASLSVAATGTAPLSYRWMKDATVISGATAPVYLIVSARLADAGNYSVVVSNAMGSVLSNSAALVVVPAGVHASHAVEAQGYVAGGVAAITNTLSYVGSASLLQWKAILPMGWTFVSDGTSGATTVPVAGNSGTITWAWTTFLPSPRSFTYSVRVPAGQTGGVELAGLVDLRLDGTLFELLAVPDPLFINPASTGTHSADTDRDFRLSLTELLRVIELYNTRNGTVRTGRYAVDATSAEDGFTTDAARPLEGVVTLAKYHSADTNHDGKLVLTELLRVIELYNYRAGTVRTGQYHAETLTEDGFAVGPSG